MDFYRSQPRLLASVQVLFPHAEVYHIRNNHPLFGIFLCEYGHPFSPLERVGLLLLLNSFAYYMAGVEQNLVSSFSLVSDFRDELPWFTGQFYNFLCITLPSLILEASLKYFAVANYKRQLKDTKYFEEKQRERCSTFAERFCSDWHLAGSELEEEKHEQQKGVLVSDVGLLFVFCYDLERPLQLTLRFSWNSKAGFDLMDLLKLAVGCAHCCVEAFESCLIGHLAHLFFSIALTASIIFLVLGINQDVQNRGQQWLSMASSLTQNFLCIWFLQTGVLFMGRWHYQHWSRKKRTICGHTVPLPEHMLEFQLFFRMLDTNRDGRLGREEVAAMVKTVCRMNLSEEGWKAVLNTLDKNNDGNLSELELEVMASEFAVKTGWWTSKPPMDTE